MRATRFTGIMLAGIAVGVAAADTLYFADIFVPDHSYGSIRKVNLDGSGLQTILPDIGGGLRALDVDATGGKVYWTDVNNVVIARSNLDGSDPENLLTTGITWPSELVVHPADGRMYWGDQVTFLLKRSDLTGGSATTLRSTSFHVGMAIDTAGGKVYWTTSDSLLAGKILRCNLDGTTQETIVTGVDKPAHVALDIAGGKVYWTDYVVDVVRRANLDGTDVETIFAVGANFNPRGIALDLKAGKVYWGQDIDFDGTGGTIMRMDLDGALPEVFLDGLGLVNDLVIVDEDAPCPGDINGDGQVSLSDLGVVLSNFGTTGADFEDGDLDGDGVVGLSDLGILLSAFGLPCP